MIVLMSFLHSGYRTLLVIPLILATALAAAYFSPWWFMLCLALIIGSGFWFARGALVVGLAIPISIIGTFLVLGILGRSLNVISLAGLAFAVGMLVDNAVVVLENIYRRYRSAKRRSTPPSAERRKCGEPWSPRRSRRSPCSCRWCLSRRRPANCFATSPWPSVRPWACRWSSR